MCLQMARFLMDSEPVEILASGMCTVSPEIKVLPGAEAFDTAHVLMRFANGKEAVIDVCRQAPYGYDQRAEVLGTKAMIQTDNSYPNTARIYSATFTGNADMPYDFFMSRYKEAYVAETLAFVDALIKDLPAPCTGEDGLIALVMAVAAGKSAEERRWVKMSEMASELDARPLLDKVLSTTSL
jgi:myo-inositol 2-dehydrogenase / D-chiro-inositol 1-dehydrogenase